MGEQTAVGESILCLFDGASSHISHYQHAFYRFERLHSFSLGFFVRVDEAFSSCDSYELGSNPEAALMFKQESDNGEMLHDY
ncbi:MAG: hypothetical protein ABSG33_12035 [Candidatus Bathyarchaeia archaeon]|jgi:hypothetical protein